VLETWTRLTGSAGEIFFAPFVFSDGSWLQLAALGSKHSGTAIILRGRR
jgi:hypothetical protein